MSEKPPLSQEDKEALLDAQLAGGDYLEKSAADAPPKAQFVDVEPERLKIRPEPAPEEPEEEEKLPENSIWGDRPTVRNQVDLYPDSVRFVDPETKILDLSKAEDLIEFNRILKASDDHEAATLRMTDVERQFHEGSWSVFVTYHKVQYLQN